MAPSPGESATAPTEPELNILQKIFRAEAKARIDAALDAPRSASSSGWCGSGRTISASPPTRCRAWPAATSARRSGRMCSAGSPTCCSRSRAIRRCCSISTTSRSIGPNSVAGINRSRGLNENLAREILELHTLGVRTGLHARTTSPASPRCSPAGPCCRSAPTRSTAASSCSIRACTSRAPQTVLGKTYPDTGVEQGRAVLADLARHPATAAHVAHQARAPFRRRRAAAGAGRAADASASSIPTAI